MKPKEIIQRKRTLLARLFSLTHKNECCGHIIFKMSPFLKALGDTPKLRVLDFLIDNDLFDYNLTEIARESNVSYNSLILFFDEFVKSGIVIRTRKQGKSELYKLNTDNLFVRHLVRLDVELTVGPLLVETNSVLLNKG